jgi:hypothetical protein
MTRTRLVNLSKDALTISAGGTFTCAGYVASSVTTLTVSTTATLTGAVTFGTGYAGTGATMTALGALSTKGAILSDTTVIGTTAVTAGLVASGKAINLDPSGTKNVPAASNINIYTDGSDLFAVRQADGKSSKISGNTGGTWT